MIRKYDEADLRFSAVARCRCGAGLAYPKDGSNPDLDSTMKMASDWFCSKLLTEKVPEGEHDSFRFDKYEIKSEDQPSAQGRTTRPFRR